MYIGRVVGTLVATRKDPSLVGSKLLITQPLTLDYEPKGDVKVMVDTVGAGIGEVVIFTTGTASRNAAGKKDSSIDAAVVGIVDNIDVSEDWRAASPQNCNLKEDEPLE